MAERIIERDSLEMYVEDQSKYMIIVDLRRMIPSVQDGLIPIQRRVLYTAFEDGLTSENKHRKTAKLVGNIMGKYHPHGDSSIAGAIANLVAWYKSKYPLMYGYGGWGNVAGDSPSSPRYTECALSSFGYDMMIDELAQAPNIVDWSDNFDKTEIEPDYLPAKIPNI